MKVYVLKFNLFETRKSANEKVREYLTNIYIEEEMEGFDTNSPTEEKLRKKASKISLKELSKKVGCLCYYEIIRTEVEK